MYTVRTAMLHGQFLPAPDIRCYTCAADAMLRAIAQRCLPYYAERRTPCRATAPGTLYAADVTAVACRQPMHSRCRALAIRSALPLILMRDIISV